MQEFLTIAAMLITLAAVGSQSQAQTGAKVCQVPVVSASWFGC